MIHSGHISKKYFGVLQLNRLNLKSLFTCNQGRRLEFWALCTEFAMGRSVGGGLYGAFSGGGGLYGAFGGGEVSMGRLVGWGGVSMGRSVGGGGQKNPNK